MNLSTVSIIEAYGFSSTSVSDFIIIKGNSVRINAINIKTNENYTNILNNSVDSRVIPYSAKGIPTLFQELNVMDLSKLRHSSSTSISTKSIQASGIVRNNHSSDGAVGINTEEWYYGTTKLMAITNTGRQWSKGGFRNGGTSETVYDCIWITGTGSPEGVYSAGVGSLYSRTDGGTNTSLYIKESGTGNTGWVAK